MTVWYDNRPLGEENKELSGQTPVRISLPG
jgi:hypothetical protein